MMRRRPDRPQDEPISTNPTGMDFEKRRLVLSGSLGSSNLTDALRFQIYYLAGIDGGDIGEPTPAMDYLLQNLDGGAI